MNVTHVVLAFVSGVVIEMLYAVGVIVISDLMIGPAALFSGLWGAAFLIGVNECFKNTVAAALWCVGLSVGAAFGVYLKKRSKAASTATAAGEFRRREEEADRVWTGRRSDNDKGGT